MNQTTCPICGGFTDAQTAHIAPFLVKRCLLESDVTRSRYCDKCDFVFFERRLTVPEATRLYSGYRGEDYNRLRLELEPGYAPLIAEFDDLNSNYYSTRLSDYARVIALYPEVRDASMVLDFGGDGNLPRRLFSEAVVGYDDLSAGESYSSQEQYNVIFASQVFEHLTSPREELARVVNCLREDGVLFLDIPIDYDGALLQAWQLHGQTGGSLVTMHEHINHFSSKSVTSLLAAVGLSPFFQVTTRNPKLAVSLACRANSERWKSLVEGGPERMIRYLSGRLAETEGRLAETEGRLAETEGKVAFANAIMQSRSWRLTGPARRIARVLRQLVR